MNSTNTIKLKYRQMMHRLWHNKDGVAYVEFALSLPFLLVLFIGSVEVTRFIIVSQKVEKSAVTISDVVSQAENITTTQLNQLITAVEQVMQPYSFDSNGFVVISSVSKTGTNAPRINWQYTGGGTWTQPSQIGTTGLTATLPNGLTLNDRDTVIIAEVYYNYTTLIPSELISNRQLYRVAVFKPRLGNLQALGS
jgi:Flp pilus assembly protein TadG